MVWRRVLTAEVRKYHFQDKAFKRQMCLLHAHIPLPPAGGSGSRTMRCQESRFLIYYTEMCEPQAGNNWDGLLFLGLISIASELNRYYGEQWDLI